MLGVLLFFDGALLALGNVCPTILFQPRGHELIERTYVPGLVEIDSVPERPDTHHRLAKDILLLCSETENTRDVVFPRRHPARIL